jgi:cobalt/nickel transport system permease protein
MALRYLFLLSQIVREMHIAKKSRTIRPGKTTTEQRWIAGQVGTLFKRSMQLSAEVHRAMVARGYQGEVRILSVFRIRKRDYIWTVFCASLSGLLIYFGR